jgi:hypothetical protein
VTPDAATRTRLRNHWSIYLEGEIDADASKRLEQLIERRQIPSASVYLASSGGSVPAAMDIARIIRRRGFQEPPQSALPTH